MADIEGILETIVAAPPGWQVVFLDPHADAPRLLQRAIATWGLFRFPTGGERIVPIIAAGPVLFNAEQLPGYVGILSPGQTVHSLPEVKALVQKVWERLQGQQVAGGQSQSRSQASAIPSLE